jgi:solute carrier family 25 (mitochondrial 2-oxodicarboxylate transporter), member 21
MFCTGAAFRKTLDWREEGGLHLLLQKLKQSTMSSSKETTTAKTMTSTASRVPLSPLENLVVGAMGGALETSLQMPILTYKFCLQEGRALPTSIPGWYRGVGVQAGTVAPITAIQFCVNGMLQKAMRVVRPGTVSQNESLRPLTDGEMMATAGGAGALSALVYSPVDLLTIQQQKLDKNVLDTGRFIYQHYGGWNGLYRGLSACAIREAVYTAGYLGLAPILSAHLVQDPRFAERPFLASVLGACLAGTTAAVLTHPVDTAKTCVQSDMSGKIWPTARAAMPKLLAQGGISSLFKGLVPRTFRLCGAFFVCMSLQNLAIGYKSEQAAGMM